MVISLERAIRGFNLHMSAEGLSKHTIQDYGLTLRRFVEFTGPMTALDTITTNHVRQFLAYWKGALVELDGVAPRPPRKLSPKTIKNMHIALSAFWTWAVREEYAEVHVIAGRIKPPRAAPPPIEPLTRQQVADLMQACNGSDRNHALMLFILDTGCRSSEICDLRIGDLDMGTGTAIVHGKGNKKREVVYGPKTGRMLFRYLNMRESYEDDDPVFLNRNGRPLSRDALAKLVSRAGKNAGIKNLHPHRLRHTFAINYLRFGGDIFTLQRQLGHSTLEMVRRYLTIADADVRQAHRKASPVENML
jgi:site-specific recombinase XerD